MGAPGACLYALVSASWTMRYAAWSDAGPAAGAPRLAQLHRGARRPGGRHQELDACRAAGGTLCLVRVVVRCLDAVAQDADDRAQFVHGGDRGLPQYPDGLALAARQRRVDLKGPGVHGDQRQLVAEAVVHVLGDALALAQPGLSGDHGALAQQLRVALLHGLQQGAALVPVAAGEAGHHGDHHEEERRDQGDGEQRHSAGLSERDTDQISGERGAEGDQGPSRPGDAPPRRAGHQEQQQGGTRAGPAERGRGDEHARGERAAQRRQDEDGDGHECGHHQASAGQQARAAGGGQGQQEGEGRLAEGPAAGPGFGSRQPSAGVLDLR